MGTTAQGNKAGRSCVREPKSASLSSEFGMKMLMAKFPQDAEAILAKLGVYSRGPRKGQPRGYIHWVKVVEGGFDYGSRTIVRPGTYDWVVRENADDRSKNVSGEIIEARIDAGREQADAELAAKIAAAKAEARANRAKTVSALADLHAYTVEEMVEEFKAKRAKIREVLAMDAITYAGMLRKFRERIARMRTFKPEY